jgi:GH35 family endo-1,4-beta-xylanase
MTHPDLTDDAINARIRQHRTTATTLKLSMPDGQPLTNAPVTIGQTSHAFDFGAIAFRLDLDRDTAHNRQFAKLFNLAILPFYWGEYERKRGEPATANHRAMATWLRDRGTASKGHPLGWHNVQPDWTIGMKPGELLDAYLDRVTREVGGFAGLVDQWDVTNEMMFAPEMKLDANPWGDLVTDLGRVEVARRGCQAARAANPAAELTLNDYEDTPRNLRFLRDCIDAGVDFDVVGLQTHMYAAPQPAEAVESWEHFTLFKEPAEVWATCEQFAALGKPLHFTELDISSGRLKDWPGQPWLDDWDGTPEGEAKQEHYLVQTYRTLFSHPAVESIVWWDFLDPGFMGAPIGLLRKDASPKPALHALHRLIHGEWTTGPLDLRTDADGRVSFRGFHGDYQVDAAIGQTTFTLAPHAGTSELRLR